LRMENKRSSSWVHIDTACDGGFTAAQRFFLP